MICSFSIDFRIKMLGESELNKLDDFSDKYNNFKSFLSKNISSKPENDTSETPDVTSEEDKFGKLFNPDTSALSEHDLLKNIIGGFSSAMSGMGSLNVKVNNSDIKNKKKSNGIIKDLIGLVKGIIQMPMRFGNLFKALGTGTAALGLGIGGLAQSIALGSKDIYLLFIAIMTIILKYTACVISFTITTIGGCLFLHFFTLLFMMIYVGIMYVVDKINSNFGVDFSSMVDEAVKPVQWPSTIQLICYSCFGSPVKLRDILADVSAVEDAGNMISYDFNNKMPRYMKPGVPLGRTALKSLDKAIN